MKSPLIIHPLLFSIFPAIFLFNHNQDMVRWSYLFWPLLITVSFMILLFLVINFFIKNKYRTALITSLIIILFFSFGHILSYIPNLNTGYFIIPGKLLVALLMIFLFIYFGMLFIHLKQSLISITIYLNIVSLILILLTLTNILLHYYQTKNILTDIQTSSTTTEFNSNKQLPDIYYILVDGYASNKILSNLYNFNNREFTNYLAEKGFYIALNSHSNYAKTYLSVASCLDFNYLNYLTRAMGKESQDHAPLKKLLNNNSTYRLLKSKGYKFIGLPSVWSGSMLAANADITLNYEINMGEFDNLYIYTTPLGQLLGKDKLLDIYRNKILYQFENIPYIALLDEPTFVFAHILSTHAPFVFDAAGGPVTPERDYAMKIIDPGHGEEFSNVNTYRRKYINQIIFTNNKIKEVVDKIITISKIQPVIIIHADHGPDMLTMWPSSKYPTVKEKMSILNAYFLPNHCYSSLYQSITPVNSFRAVFNCVLETDYEILPDNNYFSIREEPYNFIDVTSEL